MEIVQIIKVVSQGRITLPAEVRNRLGWDYGTKLRVFIEGKKVVLEESKPLKEASA